MNIQAKDISTPDRLDLSGRVVAVVDDDDLFRAFLTHMLTPIGVRVIGHANSDTLLAHIERQMPDCIILDYDIVHENGLFVQQLLRAQFVNLAPVVIMSADETQRTAVRAFRNGVDDFVQKRGLKLDEIESALRRVIAQREIGPAYQSAGGRSGGAAAIDHVTGLYSRAELDAKIVAIEELSRRTDTTVGVIAVQFAPWRALTQQFGLLVAEKVLREFARRLSSCLTSDFLCARYAQDVLCCLME